MDFDDIDDESSDTEEEDISRLISNQLKIKKSEPTS